MQRRTTHLMRGLLSCVLLATLTGCQMKQVQVTSEPRGAEVFVTKFQGGSPGQPYSVGPAPTQVSLTFDKGVSYRIEARKPQFRTASATITWEPKDQSTVHLKLEQYLKTVPATVFRLQQSQGQSPRLLPARIETQGYLDTAETGPLVTNCEVLDTESSQMEDLMWVSASKTEDMRVVFQVVTSFTPEEYDMPAEDETLREVADRHDLELADLRRMNSLPQLTTRVTKGQRLRISEPQAKTQVFWRQVGGTSATVVTDGDNTDLYPSFTWSGTEVILSSDRTSRMTHKGLSVYSLHRVHYTLPGRKMAEIISPDLQNYAPSVSSKDVVYFTTIPRGSVFPQIWSVQLNGGELSPLSDNGEFPQVSRDEGDLLFLRRVSERNSNRQVWRTSANGSDRMPLTTNENYDISSAAWSPDGNWVVYSSNQEKNADGIQNYSLWLMDRDGKRVQRLTTNGSWDDCPTWNRTGKEIFFRSNRGGKWRIWHLRLNLPS